MPEESPLPEYPIFQTWEEFRTVNTDFMSMDTNDADLDVSLIQSISASVEEILQRENRVRIRSILIKTKRHCDRLLQLEKTAHLSAPSDSPETEKSADIPRSFNHLVNGSRPPLGQTQSDTFSFKRKRGHGKKWKETGDLTGFGLLGILNNQQNIDARIKNLWQWADALDVKPSPDSTKRAELALEECLPFADEIAEQEQNKDYGQGPSPLSACKSIARHALMMIMTNTPPDASDPTRILPDAIRALVRKSLASAKRKRNAAKKKRRRRNQKNRQWLPDEH